MPKGDGLVKPIPNLYGAFDNTVTTIIKACITKLLLYQKINILDYFLALNDLQTKKAVQNEKIIKKKNKTIFIHKHTIPD